MLDSRPLRLLCSALLLMGFVTACSGDEGQQTTTECESDQDCEQGICEDGECVDDPECEANEDCTSGVCRDGVCEPLEYREDCESDAQCDSGICIETDDDQFCSRTCESDTECDPADWNCRFHQDHGEVCVPPGDLLPPSDGSTLCGAGGVSESGDLQLRHCLAPYDQASPTLEGEHRSIESGGFRLSTE